MLSEKENRLEKDVNCVQSSQASQTCNDVEVQVGQASSSEERQTEIEQVQQDQEFNTLQKILDFCRKQDGNNVHADEVTKLLGLSVLQTADSLSRNSQHGNII